MYSTNEEIESQNRNFNSYKMLQSVKAPSSGRESSTRSRSKSRSRSVTRIRSNSVFDERELIKFCLNKPENTKWELTTDTSNSNLFFPTIQLFNEKMELLAEANEPGMVIKNTDVEAKGKTNLKRSKSSTSSKSKPPIKNKPSKSASMKLDDNNNFDSHVSKRFDSLNQGGEPLKSNGPPQHNDTNNNKDEIYSERGVDVRDGNSKEFKSLRDKFEKYLENQSTLKKVNCHGDPLKYSSSLKERISELKESPSFYQVNEGPEIDQDTMSDDKQKVERQYTLRTCNLGTIIVPKDSFSTTPRRRRRGAMSRIGGGEQTKEDPSNYAIQLNDNVIADKTNSYKASDKCSLRNSEKGFTIKKSLSCDVVSDKLRDKNNKKCKSLHKRDTIILDSANLPTETLCEDENGKRFNFLFVCCLLLSLFLFPVKFFFAMFAGKHVDIDILVFYLSST